MQSSVIMLCVIFCLVLFFETTFLVLTGERMTKKIIKKLNNIKNNTEGKR